MRIGEIDLHLLSDGQVRVDPGGPFGLVPRILYEKYFVPDEENRVPEALTCLLVRSEGKTILIDTGLGNRLSPGEVQNWRLERPGGGLLGGLERLGLGAEDIDLVINTHLHSDHCGGNTYLDGDTITPTFPHATSVVQRMEWAEASFPDARTRGTYYAENFTPLLRSGQMQLLHGDTQITQHVRCVVTPGHTRGHQSVLLTSGDWQGVFLADMTSHAVHMERTAWLPSFDAAPLENLATKERWQRWALETGAWLFFQHEPVRHVGQLLQVEGRLKVEGVEAAEPLIAELPTRQPRPE